MINLARGPQVALKRYTPDAECLIVEAARVCYRSRDRSAPESDARLLRSLIARGHHSTLEHASVTVEISCTRAVANEIVRHRIGSYSQESMRYVDQSEARVYAPPSILASDEASLAYVKQVESAHEAYLDLLRQGVRGEDARLVLPLGWMTTIVCTWNLRECRHILALRGSKAALPEFREIARQLLAILQGLAPNVFADVEVEPD